MSEEDKIKIGSHIKITPGFPFNSSHFNTDGVGLPLIRIRDLLQSKIETYFKGDYTKEFLIEKDDILIGMDGDFHISRWKNERVALLNQRIMKVEQKKEALIDINYFYYFLFPFLKDVWDKTTATTVKHLSTYDVSEAYEKFPALPEQSKIAKILSTVDAVIEKTQAAIDKYKAIKQGMLYDLFTRGIDVLTGKLRPKYEDAPELYKESKLGKVPKEWDVKPLEVIAVIHNGIDYKRNPPGQEIPIYGTGGIMGFTSISLNNGPAVLTGRKGSINRPIYVEGEFWNVDTIFCLKPKEKINTKWLYYNILLTDMNKYNEATGVPSIASKTLYKLNFCHYDIEEQNKIIEFITPIENTLQAEESSLLKLKQLKTGLMSDLLSGKKRVVVKEEEKAKN